MNTLSVEVLENIVNYAYHHLEEDSSDHKLFQPWDKMSFFYWMSPIVRSRRIYRGKRFVEVMKDMDWSSDEPFRYMYHITFRWTYDDIRCEELAAVLTHAYEKKRLDIGHMMYRECGCDCMWLPIYRFEGEAALESAIVRRHDEFFEDFEGRFTGERYSSPEEWKIACFMYFCKEVFIKALKTDHHFFPSTECPRTYVKNFLEYYEEKDLEVDDRDIGVGILKEFVELSDDLNFAKFDVQQDVRFSLLYNLAVINSGMKYFHCL
jgi:hypothetical protein